MAIEYWNRRKNTLETEKVYGDAFVRILYGSPLAYSLTDRLLVGKTLSRLYGSWQGLGFSSGKVAPFIEFFGIPMGLFEPGPFRTFNDFFIRRFREGMRPFPTARHLMGAPAEARYLAFANTATSLPVKGVQLDPMALLGRGPDKKRFRGGPCLLARLCPVDYHRFHFPDDGRVVHTYRETGKLHSVNPLALERNPGLLLENERQVSVLETKNFGLLAYVEVGALCVGRIVQSHPQEQPFQRGQEKGYFLFGGSTVVVYGEPGAWMPDQDLLDRSAKGLETLVELGSPLAHAPLLGSKP